MGALPPFLSKDGFDPHKNKNPIVDGVGGLDYCPGDEVITQAKPLPLKQIHQRVSVCMANTNFAARSPEECAKILRNVQILNEKFAKHNQKLQLKNAVWQWILSWFGIHQLTPLPTQALEVRNVDNVAKAGAAAAPPSSGGSLVFQSVLSGEREVPKPQYKVDVSIDKSTYTGDPGKRTAERKLKENLEKLSSETLGGPIKCHFRISTSGVFLDDLTRDRPVEIYWHPVQKVFYIETNKRNPVRFEGEDHPRDLVENYRIDFKSGLNTLEIDGYKFTLTLTKTD